MKIAIKKQLGVTDEVDTCFCCGRTGLKRTVVFQTTEDWQDDGGDAFVFYGTSCAATAKASSGLKFDDRRSTVNSNGLTQSEQADADDRAKVKVNYARLLVAKGRTLPHAWGVVRRLEAQDNGIYRMAMILKAEA